MRVSSLLIIRIPSIRSVSSPHDERNDLPSPSPPSSLPRGPVRFLLAASLPSSPPCPSALPPRLDPSLSGKQSPPPASPPRPPSSSPTLPLPPAHPIMPSPPPEPEVKKRKRACGSSVPRWTCEEEERLKALVHSLGAKAWGEISRELGTNRSGSGVEQHWNIMTGKRKRNGKKCVEEGEAFADDWCFGLKGEGGLSPEMWASLPPGLLEGEEIVRTGSHFSADSFTLPSLAESRLTTLTKQGCTQPPRPLTLLEGEGEGDVDASWRWVLHGEASKERFEELELSCPPEEEKMRQDLPPGWSVQRKGRRREGGGQLPIEQAEELVERFQRLRSEGIEQSVELFGWMLHYKRRKSGGGGDAFAFDPRGAPLPLPFPPNACRFE